MSKSHIALCQEAVIGEETLARDAYFIEHFNSGAAIEKMHEAHPAKLVLALWEVAEAVKELPDEMWPTPHAEGIERIDEALNALEILTAPREGAK